MSCLCVCVVSRLSCLVLTFTCVVLLCVSYVLTPHWYMYCMYCIDTCRWPTCHSRRVGAYFGPGHHDCGQISRWQNVPRRSSLRHSGLYYWYRCSNTTATATASGVCHANTHPLIQCHFFAIAHWWFCQQQGTAKPGKICVL